MRADLRLAVPVAIAWAAAATLIAVPTCLPWVAAALWAATATMIVVASRRRGSRILPSVALACAITAMVITIAAARAPARQPEDLIAASDAGRHAAAEVIAGERVVPGAPFDGTLVRITFGSRTQSLSVPVTVFPSPQSKLRSPIGTTISVPCTLVASAPADESAFRLFASGGAHAVAHAPGYLTWSNALRRSFGAVSSALPGDGGALLPGLAIGDTSGVGSSLDAAMKSSSLSHLTAVSGANCAVIIAIIMAIGARLGIPRGWRIAAAAAVLVGFVVLVTPQPSVLRAAVMAGIVLVATARGRPAGGVPILALATVTLLVVDPWLARSYGFVLSVLATAGLLLLARPLAERLGGWMPQRLATLIAIPLAAQLACQPVLVLLNPSIPTYGVVANLLAEPAAPAATVLGLVACLVAPALPAVATVVATLAWVPSSWIAGVARFFAALPGSTIPWPGGAPGVALVTVIALASLIVMLGRPVPRLRIVAAVVLVGTAVTVVAVVAGDDLRTRLTRPQDWQIAACDIGQGDAVLVRSLGVVALIDTGPEPARLSHCLSTLGVPRIDLLILSHYDLDHVGGTSAVFGRVTRALIGPTSDANDERLAEQLAAHGAVVQHVSQGLTGVLGELGWKVLWPRARLGGVQPGNDASVTVRFAGVGSCAAGCLTSVFLGDLGEEPQALVLAANPSLDRVDVVKVAHHGSADQNEQMYQTLHAAIGLISVGLGNRYGHPTDRLLGILARAGTTPMRTDQEGMVLVSPWPGGGMSVWSERSMAASKRLHH